MRLARRVTLTIVALGLMTLTLDSPAGARQTITYTGEHSQVGRVRFFVDKKSNGVRVIRNFGIRGLTATCEDGSTSGLSASVGLKERLADDGSFEVTRGRSGPIGLAYRYTVAGDVGFRTASGIFEFRYATLNDDGDAQLCTTGDVEWTAQRQPPGSAGLPREPRIIIH
jgi:hypothetical protein